MRFPLMQPRMRLFCFSYAGGSAVGYLDWQKSLVPDIEVCAIQLPGRGNLFHETAITDMRILLDYLVPAMAEQIGRSTLPCALFGHSLGALLAFEVARHLPRHLHGRLAHMFVSGCEAPSDRSHSKGLHRLPDIELIEELKRFEGTPPEILEHQELMKLVLPTIRADFMLAESYVYVPGPPLSTPLTVLAGREDKDCEAVRVRSWCRETERETDFFWLNGGHFFIQSQQAAVLERVRETLIGCLQAPALDC
jgi:medium-chain acyl-[acyl-carrier-protein] hydrolase